MTTQVPIGFFVSLGISLRDRERPAQMPPRALANAWQGPREVSASG